MGVVSKISRKALIKILEEEIRRIHHYERYIKPWERKAA